MENHDTIPIIWKIEGRILDREAFDTILSQLVAQARQEEGTLLYWWCLDATGERYSDIDCYRDEAAALAHLNGWAQHAEVFAHCATIESCTVYGDVSEEVKARLAGLNPCYASPYSGFCKQGQLRSTGAESPRDVIWSLEGRIMDTEKFHDIVTLATAHGQVDEASRLHWWTVTPLCAGESVGESERHFHVLLHYDRARPLDEYRQIWQSYGHLFLNAAVIDRVCIYGDGGESPAGVFFDKETSSMHYLAGFAK